MSVKPRKRCHCDKCCGSFMSQSTFYRHRGFRVMEGQEESEEDCSQPESDSSQSEEGEPSLPLGVRVRVDEDDMGAPSSRSSSSSVSSSNCSSSYSSSSSSSSGSISSHDFTEEDLDVIVYDSAEDSDYVQPVEAGDEEEDQGTEPQTIPPLTHCVCPQTNGCT